MFPLQDFGSVHLTSVRSLVQFVLSLEALDASRPEISAAPPGEKASNRSFFCSQFEWPILPCSGHVWASQSYPDAQ